MNWSTILLSLAVALVSAITVHVLTKSREQETWARNCAREEWRELVTALSKAEMAILRFANEKTSSTLDNKKVDTFDAAYREAIGVMMDRIFIVDDITRIQLIARWTASKNKYDLDRDVAEYIAELVKIKTSLINAATMRR